jgi:hypothetical protein
MKPRAKTTSIPYGDFQQNAVNLRASDWELLRSVADARAAKHGGRRSVSAVIAKLIESKRKQLEREQHIVN